MSYRVPFLSVVMYPSEPPKDPAAIVQVVCSWLAPIVESCNAHGVKIVTKGGAVLTPRVTELSQVVESVPGGELNPIIELQDASVDDGLVERYGEQQARTLALGYCVDYSHEERSVSIHVNLDRYLLVDITGRARELVQKVAELAPLSSGLIELADGWSTGAGLLYFPGLRLSTVDPVRQIEANNWDLTWRIRRKSVVRGVFWGTILGSPILNKMGKTREVLVDEFRAVAPRVTRQDDFNCADGSVGFYLSERPLAFTWPFGSLGPLALDRAWWLRSVLSEHGLLM